MSRALVVPQKEIPTPGTLRFRLTIAYRGTAYAGWQTQKTGIGVQQIIEQAFGKIFGAPCCLHSSSRTDAGVHALGMSAHVEIPKSKVRMPLRKLALAVNSALPEDVRIIEARKCSPTFHARFDASGKQYRYFVWNHHSHNPLFNHQAWLVPGNLDLAAMRRAGNLLVGTHDFVSFAGTREYQLRSTIRTITRCQIRKQGPMLTFTFEGDGFLYRMCRGLAGTLIQVGQGKFGPEEVTGMIASKDRRVAGMTAPAHGLVLWKVFYHKGKKRDAHRLVRTGNST
jgi:tRNA pseudouridine38-40 synthase